MNLQELCGQEKASMTRPHKSLQHATPMPLLRGILNGACMEAQTDLKLTPIHEAKPRDATMCISLIDFLMTLLAILLRSARNRHASQCLATTILGLQDEIFDPQRSPQKCMMFGGFMSIRIQNAQTDSN